MTFDISDTLAPNSDQLDAVDLIAGPKTFVIDHVSRGNAEQPVQIHLVDFPRPWRPSKNMRRVIAAAWGTDASRYSGRAVTLYCDGDVMFGKDRVAGTRISHLSHIAEPMTVVLLAGRGKSSTWRVEPIPVPKSTGPTVDDIAECSDVDTLRGWYRAVTDSTLRDAITARVAQLKESTA